MPQTVLRCVYGCPAYPFRCVFMVAPLIPCVCVYGYPAYPFRCVLMVTPLIPSVVCLWLSCLSPACVFMVTLLIPSVVCLWLPRLSLPLCVNGYPAYRFRCVFMVIPLIPCDFIFKLGLRGMFSHHANNSSIHVCHT